MAKGKFKSRAFNKLKFGFGARMSYRWYCYSYHIPIRTYVKYKVLSVSQLVILQLSNEPRWFWLHTLITNWPLTIHLVVEILNRFMNLIRNVKFVTKKKAITSPAIMGRIILQRIYPLFFSHQWVGFSDTIDVQPRVYLGLTNTSFNQTLDATSLDLKLTFFSF